MVLAATRVPAELGMIPGESAPGCVAKWGTAGCSAWAVSGMYRTLLPYSEKTGIGCGWHCVLLHPRGQTGGLNSLPSVLRKGGAGRPDGLAWA